MVTYDGKVLTWTYVLVLVGAVPSLLSDIFFFDLPNWTSWFTVAVMLWIVKIVFCDKRDA